MAKYLRGNKKEEVEKKYSDYINSSAIDKEKDKWRLNDVFNSVVYYGSLKDIKTWYSRILEDFPTMAEEVLYKSFERMIHNNDMNRNDFKRLDLLYGYGINLDFCNNFFMFMTPVRDLIKKSELYDWVFKKDFNPNILCPVYGSYLNKYLNGFVNGDLGIGYPCTESNRLVEYDLAVRLLKRGADINVRSKSGCSVANIAMGEFHKNYDSINNTSSSKVFDLMMNYGFVPDYKIENNNIIILLDTYCNTQHSNPTYNWISHGDNMKIYKAFECKMKVLAEKHFLSQHQPNKDKVILRSKIRL